MSDLALLAHLYHLDSQTCIRQIIMESLYYHPIQVIFCAMGKALTLLTFKSC